MTEQQEHHQNFGLVSGTTEKLADIAPHLVTVVLTMLEQTMKLVYFARGNSGKRTGSLRY